MSRDQSKNWGTLDLTNNKNIQKAKGLQLGKFELHRNKIKPIISDLVQLMPSLLEEFLED